MVVLALACAQPRANELECRDWPRHHPEWLWCDDFESDTDPEHDYFDVDRAGGRFGVATDAVRRPRRAEGSAENPVTPQYH
jgi:hypothetical protein